MLGFSQVSPMICRNRGFSKNGVFSSDLKGMVMKNFPWGKPQGSQLCLLREHLVSASPNSATTPENRRGASLLSSLWITVMVYVAQRLFVNGSDIFKFSFELMLTVDFSPPGHPAGQRIP